MNSKLVNVVEKKRNIHIQPFVIYVTTLRTTMVRELHNTGCKFETSIRRGKRQTSFPGNQLTQENTIFFYLDGRRCHTGIQDSCYQLGAGQVGGRLRNITVTPYETPPAQSIVDSVGIENSIFSRVPEYTIKRKVRLKTNYRF